MVVTEDELVAMVPILVNNIILSFSDICCDAVESLVMAAASSLALL